MKRVRFTIKAPKAKQVLLAADFTDWEANARRMRPSRTERGAFTAIVPLEPGTYQYKFLVDGEWREDPSAATIPNSFGTLNSVVRVEA